MNENPATHATPAEPASPLARADDAKRSRDLVGELAALTTGYTALTSAPWYPAQAGDLVHLAFGPVGDIPAYGETYSVRGRRDGLLRLTLLHHTYSGATEQLMGIGCFATSATTEPLTEMWMEAGPHRLTIVRHGQVLHDGPSQHHGGPQ